MTRKRSVPMLLALTMLLAIACGRGGETAAYEYEDENGETAAAGGESAPAAQQPAPAVADAATVVGAVRLNGTPPAAPAIQMAADPACQAAHATPVRSEEIIVGPGGELANVFVYVKDYNGPAPRPSQPALLDQKGCQYIPHVSGVQVGQTIRIRNSDPTLHNVHALAQANPEFNIGQPVQGMVSEKVFNRPEVMVRFKCDVHNWMNSYVGVLPHPYFGTSDSQGSFRIANLPPGTYTLEAWHEKFGTQTQQVTVGPNEEAQVSFTFNVS